MRLLTQVQFRTKVFDAVEVNQQYCYLEACGLNNIDQTHLDMTSGLPMGQKKFNLQS